VTAGPRALQLIRAAYGSALILRPGPAIQLATGRLPSRRACLAARVLGARHLAQAALADALAEAAFAAAGLSISARRV
jgi:hypothetical protein